MTQLSLVVAVPTFICSLLSFVASSTFALFYYLYPPERHFRQALVINLLLSDFINSLNNTISGAIALSRWKHDQALSPGKACIANGYIGQFSVQAIDFNILIISLAVLLTVRQSSIALKPSLKQVMLVCAVPWIPPLITSNVALGLGLYGPVSGNWCWIKPQYLGFRYALTHGWRIGVFIITIGIYTYVYIYLLRVYGKLSVSSISDSLAQESIDSGVDLDAIDQRGKRHTHVQSSIPSEQREHDQTPLRVEEEAEADGPLRPRHLRQPSSRWKSMERKRDSMAAEAQIQILTTGSSEEVSRAKKQALRKMLLLNGYPICYIILWIPGISNRIAESVGTSPLWLRALQASTQLVGFANALTYAYNEQLLQRIRTR